jgi:DNA-binding MarR family transcriptional regulator
VFLVATPFGALAFLLAWTIKDVPLRATTGTPDPADTLAPTARPTVRTSDQEMERALTRILGREQQREVYVRLATTAGIAASPHATWLLLRVGQHPGMSRRDLATLLQLPRAELERRLTELVAIGYVRGLREDLDQPVPLTEAGKHAYDQLFQARHAAVTRLCADWDPDQHPGLLALLDQLTNQLAAHPDLEPAEG